jgi:hypothetical protein
MCNTDAFLELAFGEASEGAIQALCPVANVQTGKGKTS